MLKRLSTSLVMLGVIGDASAATTGWISQNGAGHKNGMSCADAAPASALNSASNWSTASPPGPLGPGVTVKLCSNISTAITFPMNPNASGGDSTGYFTIDGSGTYKMSGIYTNGASYIKIQNVHWFDNLASALWIISGGSNVQVLNSYADNVVAGMLLAKGPSAGEPPQNILIQNNWFRQAIIHEGAGDSTEYDLFKATSGTDVTVSSNYLEFRMDGGNGAGGAHNDLFQTFKDRGACSGSCAPTNWTLKFNRFVLNTAAPDYRSVLQMEDHDGTLDIFSNVFLVTAGNNGSACLNIGGGFATASHTRIYNNTVDIASGSCSSVWHFSYPAAPAEFGWAGNYTGTRGQIPHDETVPFTYRDRNVFYDPTLILDCTGTTDLCLTASTPPGFTNAAAGDYSLATGSPLIAEATNLGVTWQQAILPGSAWPNPPTSPSSVLTGNRASTGMWDAGAYKF